MQNIRVSILTVCLNAEKTIARTIESVLNQSYSPDEYYVIDGQSEDNTLNIVKIYEKKFLEKGIHYHVISEYDKGMYDALNKGARLATGELIGQINSDDWYELDAIQKMVGLYQDTNFDMAYADLRMVPLNKSSWIKIARIDKFVNSRHWNHPTQFTKRNILLQKPYACQCMSDDLDLMLWVRSHGLHIEILNEVIANFTITGMSHSKAILDVMNRIKTKSVIYRKNGYSVLHILDVMVVEMGKIILEW